MDVPSSSVPLEHLVVHVEECLELLGHLSFVLSCFDWLV